MIFITVLVTLKEGDFAMRILHRDLSSAVILSAVIAVGVVRAQDKGRLPLSRARDAVVRNALLGSGAGADMFSPPDLKRILRPSNEVSKGNEVSDVDHKDTSRFILDSALAGLSPQSTVTGSGTSGQVTFWTGTSTVSGDSAMTWDNTNKRLNLGASTSGVATFNVGSDLSDILGLSINSPVKIGVSHGTSGSPVDTASPSLSMVRYDHTTGTGTLAPYFFGTVKKDGGTKAAIYNLYGYISSDDTTETNKDIVGLVGFSVANSGSTSRPIAIYGESTLYNQHTGQVGTGAELDVVNLSGSDAPVITNSLPAGTTIALDLVGKGSKNSAGIHFQSFDGQTSAFRVGINFSSNVIASTGYGIDFHYAGTSMAAPIRFANGTLLVWQKNGGTGGSSDDLPTIGVQTDDSLRIKSDVGTVFTDIASTVGYLTVSPNGVLAGDGNISAGAILDVNGGDTKGLRIRSRSTTGAPSSGSWNRGTLIVDSGGVLYICTANGTPGTWQKVGAQ